MVAVPLPESKRRRRGNNKEKVEKEKPGQSKAVLIQLEGEKWFEYGSSIKERNWTLASHPSPSEQQDSGIVKRYRADADSLYRREVQNFGQHQTSDDRWVDSTIHKGTLKDRVAAMSVVVSSNPIHKLHSLDGLLQMGGCGQQNANSRVAHLASQALEDLFLHTFLPSDRKLLTMDQRPLHLFDDKKKAPSPRVLILWRFEELLKEKYLSFIREYLSPTLRDGLELHKIFAIRSAATLLRSVPEGESLLLSIIVNKLGDPARKVAAAATHELFRVLMPHPQMQLIVAREVQQLVHRPHLSERALYNCVTFLNQLKLGRDDSVLPASLVKTYFRLFEVGIKHDKNKDSSSVVSIRSRLLSALLTGVNRAHPYLSKDDKQLDDHVDSLYRVAHTAQPSSATQALQLLFHVSIGTKNESRFYRALHATISRSTVIGVGKHLTVLFNLIYKALKSAKDETQIIALSKQLLSTALHCNSSVIAATLFLLNEAAKVHDCIRSCLEDVIEDRDAILDVDKRDPALKGTGVPKRAALWEYSLTSFHYHPSVAKFSTEVGDYQGDPLRDFGLSAFLDKFAYRNPKSIARVVDRLQKGASVAQRRSEKNEFAAPVNDPSFVGRTDVDADEEFFHRFFVEQTRRDKIKGIVRHKSQDDVLDAEEEMLESGGDVTFQWETDSEEEAFVDSLAEKIMEDANEDLDVDDLDEEDPDMDDWDDMYDDDKAEADPDDDGDDFDAMPAGDGAGEMDDTFMEDEDEDDDSSEDEAPEGLDDEVEGPQFADERDDSEGDDEDEGDWPGNAELLDDDEDGVELLGESSSDEGPDPTTEDTFADAEEYEAMISASWKELTEGSTKEKDDKSKTKKKNKKRKHRSK